MTLRSFNVQQMTSLIFHNPLCSSVPSSSAEQNDAEKKRKGKKRKEKERKEKMKQEGSQNRQRLYDRQSQPHVIPPWKGTSTFVPPVFLEEKTEQKRNRGGTRMKGKTRGT